MYRISNLHWIVIALTFLCSQNLFSQGDYFQQEVNFKIQVRLDDENHYLHAFETIEYINNSSTELEFIYFHLWPNAYKNTGTAFAKQELENGSGKFYFTAERNRGFIDSLDFKVDGESLKWQYHPEHIDICKVALNSPLKQGEKVVITTPFRVKVPGDFSRLGHDGQSYQITQWYPKPAVFDREGWHEMPYLDQGEFYSEFGSFDVEISLPKNYVVGATGNLQNKDELDWLTQKANETSKLKDFNKDDKNFPESSEEFKILRYTESRVHDFAWFADKRYHVLKDSVYLKNSDHWVTTWSMFLNKRANLWMDSPEYIKDAVLYYSQWYGDYPYNNCTAVRGALSAGGGMEYPTITVIGDFPSALLLEDVIMHEVGHNWFYGILGFNERDYPYLDEGLNSFSEMRYMKTKYKNEKMLWEMIGGGDIVGKLGNFDDVPMTKYYSISPLMSMRLNKDQPMNLHSNDYLSINYGVVVYHKSAIAFNYLMHYLGEDEFNKIMQGFYEEWKFKHPGPKDFKAAFEQNTEKDLSWFFDELVPTTKKIDYKAIALRDGKIKVRNTGDINSPVAITGYSGEKRAYQFVEPGFEKSKWINLPDDVVDRVVVNDIALPEINKKNNAINTAGLAKRSLPLEINPVQVLEKENKKQLGVVPAMGWNYYNKYMLGLAFYSPALPFQKIEYQVVPMYAFGNNNLSGAGQITAHTFPFKNAFERVDFTLSGMRFGYGINSHENYGKIDVGVELFFKKKRARSPFHQSMKFSYMNVSDLLQINSSRAGLVDNVAMLDYFRLDYKLKKTSRLSPYSVKLSAEGSENSKKVSGEFKFAKLNRKSKEAFRLSLFGGAFITSPDNYVHGFKLSGTSGFADYTYNDLYFGRFEPFGSNGFSQQFVRNEGGFAIPNLIASNNWMLAANGDIRLARFPLYIYLNVAVLGDPIDYSRIPLPLNTNINGFAYETGVYLDFRNIVKVYFPIVYSNQVIDSMKEITSNYGQRIRFSIALKDMNPFKLRYSMF